MGPKIVGSQVGITQALKSLVQKASKLSGGFAGMLWLGRWESLANKESARGEERVKVAGG